MFMFCVKNLLKTEYNWYEYAPCDSVTFILILLKFLIIISCYCNVYILFFK